MQLHVRPAARPGNPHQPRHQQRGLGAPRVAAPTTSSSSSSVACAAAKKQKPKRRTRKGNKPVVSQRPSFVEDFFDDDDEDDDAGDAGGGSSRGRGEVVLVPGSKGVPKAPPPAATPPAGSGAVPRDLYPVSLQQQQAGVTRLQNNNSKWAWEDQPPPPPQQQQPAPLWNPKTGFMRTRADAEGAAAATAAGAGAAGSSPAGSSAPPAPGSGSGGSSTTISTAAACAAPAAPAAARAPSSTSGSSSLVEPLPPPAAALPPPPPPGQLAAVSREQVLGSCGLTSAAMVGAAVAVRLLAAQQSAALFGTSQADVDRLLQLPPGLQDAQQAGVLLAVAGAVTAARLLLQQRWAGLAEAAARANQQVLGPLGLGDAALVALLSGASEELLFRGALVPATWPDARGVLLSGAVFGVLHVSGGRNLAYAAWASGVGWLYGAAFLATGNVWVPAGAHALANFAAAAVWLRGRQGGGDGGKEEGGR